ncbi:MAG: hypothetical protein ACJ8FU_10535, partial [Xanthobacteraceae bacterium]
MQVLADMNLSPGWVGFLAEAGFEAVHMTWRLVILAAVSLFTHHCWAAEEEIVFAPKNFWDSKDSFGDGFINVSGTLTGEGLGYKNNTYSLSCYKDRMECWVSYVEQIGPAQVGRMSAPDIYPIAKWDS